MRILIVSEAYPPIPHVAGRRASVFAAALHGRGHEVSVATGAPAEGPTGRSDEAGIEVVRLPSPAASLFTVEVDTLGPVGRQLRRARTTAALFRTGAYADWVAAVRAELRAGPAPDVIWAIHGSLSPLALGRLVAADHGVPWVADFKDDWGALRLGFERRVVLAAVRRQLRGAVAVTAASDMEAARFSADLGRPVASVYTPVDPVEPVEPLDLGPGFNLVFTGHLSRGRMQVGWVADAVRSLRAEVGDGSIRLHYWGHDPDPWRDAFGADGGALVAHGFADRATVARAQRAADLLVHTPYTVAPTLCVKTLEYAASGRPVWCVPSETDAAVLEALGVGETLDADSADAARATLAEAYHRWRRDGRAADVVRDVSAFHVDRQSARLAGILEQAATRGRRGTHG